MSLEDFSSSRNKTTTGYSSASDGLRFWKAPPIVQYFASFLMTAMATAVAAGFDRYEAIPNLSLIYVVPVVIGSVLFGFGPSLFSAVLGALAYNFFFTAPRLSLTVADTENIWAIVLLFVVACIVSAVTSFGRRTATNLEWVRQEEQALKNYASKMKAARSIDEATKLTVTTLGALFHSPVTVLLATSEHGNVAIEGGKNLAPIEIKAAKSSLASGSVVTAGVYPFDESRYDFWPVETVSGRPAIIGIAFDPERRPADPAVIIDIVALLLGATIDRFRE